MALAFDNLMAVVEESLSPTLRRVYTEIWWSMFMPQPATLNIPFNEIRIKNTTPAAPITSIFSSR